MYLWVGDSSVPNLSPAVSVHRRTASEQMVAKTVEVAKNQSQNCPFWLRASTLIVGALFAHLHSALIRARRLGSHRRASGSRQMPLWQLRSFFAFDFPAWLLRTPSSTMRSLLPSGTAKRNIGRRREEGLPGLTRFIFYFIFFKWSRMRNCGQTATATFK